LLACLAFGCHRTDPSEAQPAGSASAKLTKPEAAPPKAHAGETAHIPVGAFRAGSLPGDPGRRPELEPGESEVRLGPFQIDRLPYPNDPTKPPLVGVTREAAMRMCADQNARLCTELEWERACKGPENLSYSTGSAWKEECLEAPERCENGYEVMGMGNVPEWTSSEVIPPRGESKPLGPVVRGAEDKVPGAERRCARRVTPADLPDDTKVGFRCCHGAPNGAKVEEPALGDAFKKAELDAPALAKLLEADPRTAPLAKELVLFREPDAAQTVIERGPGDRMGFDFTVAPLEWSPSRGARVLVVTGRSGEKTSFVLAYYVFGKADYRLAASFIMQNEPGPVALAYSPSIRPRLHFSTCWGCPGETGKLLFRAPERVVIFQP
jgi:hypothetical protein